MRKIKGISYETEKDKDIIKHIDKQQNGSRYVLDLVEKDMNKTDISTIIKREIDKYLRERNIKEIEENTDAEVQINKDEILDIMGL